MYELLSPKVDFVFKKIFGNEKHPKILISFLNAVMKPKDLIKEVKLQNSDIEKEHLDDKFSRLDIKAKTNTGELINIEIQLKNEYNMIKRSLYYWSKMYESQLVKGENYDELVKTVCINILDFKYLATEEAHTCYRLKEVESNEELTDIQEIHFIELPKLNDESEDISDMFTAWMEFINNPISTKLNKVELDREEIKEAKEELIRLSGDKKERELYEDRKAAILDRVSALENAERKGIEKGIEKGEYNKSIEIAKNLLIAGISNETISISTGLSVEEIENLK